MISRALTLGAFAGFLLAFAPSCGQTQIARCQPSNCDGCCDESGQCRAGNELDACGVLGTQCETCASSQACEAGACRGLAQNPSDGGSENDGGVTCSPDNCNGCCVNNECTPGDQKDACGSNGGVCSVCPGAQSCIGGTCMDQCTGCRDAAGNCLAGDDVTACGANGNVCASCFSGQVCQNGSCVNTSCSATNCNGCCAGDTCIQATTDAQCGTGGAACATCQNGATCQGGVCTGGNTGTDGGFPIPTDGGFGNCGPSNCAGCCSLGQCLPGDDPLFFCGAGGVECVSCAAQFMSACKAGVCQFF